MQGTADIRRRKAPLAVRASVLEAAAEVAVERGLQGLTLEAVAQRAGVSKGGLQYHFRSKQSLLDALFDDVLTRFRTRIDAHRARDAEAHGAAARAYLRATLDEMTMQPAQPASAQVLRLLSAAMMTDPEMRERWSAPMRALQQPDPLPLQQSAATMLCRLVADGLWIADLLGYLDIPDVLRAEIVRQAEGLTLPTGGASR